MADGKPLVLTRTVACVTDANHLVELVLAHAENLPAAKVDLLADGVRLEPATIIEEREGPSPADPLGLDQRPARERRPADALRRRQSAESDRAQQESARSKITTVRWDLAAFRQARCN